MKVRRICREAKNIRLFSAWGCIEVADDEFKSHTVIFLLFYFSEESGVLIWDIGSIDKRLDSVTQ